MEEDAESFECTNCGASLAEAGVSQSVQWLECSCGYLNAWLPPTRLPLAKAVERLLPADMLARLMADTSDVDRVLEAHEQALGAVIEHSRAIVRHNVRAAQSSLRPLLELFEETSVVGRRRGISDGRAVAINRTMQLLLGLLWEMGRPAFVNSQVPADDVANFIARFSEVASNVGILPSLIENIRAGHVKATIQQGDVLVKPARLNRGMTEWLKNRDRLWQEKGRPPAQDAFSAASLEAQEAMLGFSPGLLRELLAEQHARLKSLALEFDKGVYVLPDRSANPDTPEARALERLTLTKARVEAFTEPYYWDLGLPGRAVLKSEDMARKLAMQNWVNYYPVLPVVDEHGASYLLVSAEALTNAAANLGSFKGRLLERVYDSLRGQGSSAVLKHVAALREDAHRAFEGDAARELKKLGFAVSSLVSVAGDRLKGGQIDVLGVKSMGPMTVLLLGEVKDFDLAIHRPRGVARLAGRVKGATKQLHRKALDLRACWRLVLAEKFPEFSEHLSDVRLVTVVIVSQYLPPVLQQGIPIVAIDELPAFVRYLEAHGVTLPQKFSAALHVLSGTQLA